jgi:hypothetical protein
MNILLSLTEIVGWLMFIYLGGAGVYEMLGGRKVRASALLAAAVGWVVVTFVLMWLARQGDVVAVILLLVYFAALGWVARKVYFSLGKPDMDVR